MGGCRRFLWDLFDAPRGHKLEVTSVALSAQHVLSGSKDATAKLWAKLSGELLHTFTLPAEVTSVALDARAALVGCGDCSVTLWSVETYQELHRFFCDDAVVAVAMDASRVLASSRDKVVTLWSRAEETCGALLKQFDPQVPGESHTYNHTDVVNSVALMGHLALLGSEDGGTKLYDLDSYIVHNVEDWVSKEQLVAEGTSRIAACAVKGVAMDSQHVVTVDSQQRLNVWGFEHFGEGELAGFTGKYLGRRSGITSVALDGRNVLTGHADMTASLLDRTQAEGPQDWKLVRTLQGSHQDEVRSVAMHSGFVLTGSCDHTAKLWDADRASPLASYEGARFAVALAAVELIITLMQLLSFPFSSDLPWNEAAEPVQLVVLGVSLEVTGKLFDLQEHVEVLALSACAWVLLIWVGAYRGAGQPVKVLPLVMKGLGKRRVFYIRLNPHVAVYLTSAFLLVPLGRILLTVLSCEDWGFQGALQLAKDVQCRDIRAVQGASMAAIVVLIVVLAPLSVVRHDLGALPRPRNLLAFLRLFDPRMARLQALSQGRLSRDIGAYRPSEHQAFAVLALLANKMCFLVAEVFFREEKLVRCGIYCAVAAATAAFIMKYPMLLPMRAPQLLLEVGLQSVFLGSALGTLTVAHPEAAFPAVAYYVGVGILGILQYIRVVVLQRRSRAAEKLGPSVIRVKPATVVPEQLEHVSSAGGA